MSGGADRGAPAGRAASATVTVAGLATSRGYAAGPVFVYSKDSVLSVPEYAIAESAVESEIARYRAARAETRRQVEELVAKFKSDTDGLATDVLSNHLLLLDDPTADAAVERTSRTACSASCWTAASRRSTAFRSRWWWSRTTSRRPRPSRSRAT